MHMGTDETIEVSGQTITARDHPRGEFGVYRHYEIGEQKFDSLEDARTFAKKSAKPVKVAPVKPTMPAASAAEGGGELGHAG